MSAEEREAKGERQAAERERQAAEELDRQLEADGISLSVENVDGGDTVCVPIMSSNGP